MIDRRALLASLAVAGAAGRAAAQIPSPGRTEIDVSGRKVAIYSWIAESPRGAVVFSHGAGASPAAYGGLLRQWQAAGLTVYAPLHVDSMEHPDRDKYASLAAVFIPRWRDVSATVAYARAQTPGVKLAAAGHSYGSLFALMMAGGLPAMFGPPKQPVDAVVAFSSPGKIQPLVKPDAYGSVRAPLLLLTGDADVVPGAVADWHEHLFAYETSAPGDKYAWVGKGVDHLYGGAIDRKPDPNAQNAAFAEASALSTLFLRAYVEDDRGARAGLDQRSSTSLAEFSRR